MISNHVSTATNNKVQKNAAVMQQQELTITQVQTPQFFEKLGKFKNSRNNLIRKGQSKTMNPTIIQMDTSINSNSVDKEEQADILKPAT